MAPRGDENGNHRNGNDGNHRSNGKACRLEPLTLLQRLPSLRSGQLVRLLP
jgi:hypothetical protein